MSFAEIHIGKSLNEEITSQDLIDYFSQAREESLTLEFKSFVADKNGGFNFDGVLRTITAFLNSEGGLLIFGAPSEVAVHDKYRVVKGELTPIPTTLKTKDALVNLIHGAISYMPVGIRVAAVNFTDGYFVYLIEVQESKSKPHQFKKEYPIRLDGQSIGAPHYVVEALFRQTRRPELLGYLRVVQYQMHDQHESLLIEILLEASIFNSSIRENDSDIYINLTTSLGEFENIAKDTGLNFTNDNKGVNFQKQGSIITNGFPLKKQFRLFVNNSDLIELSDKTIKLMLAFGGKASITKFSKYALRFNFYSLRFSPNDKYKQYTRAKDLENLLSISRDENSSSHDIWDGQQEEKINNSLNGI
ncbi:helix-turn-helix domain-containing protein [Fibrella sp. WM1]|uniref:AlbA family DNA-binding domain-containing protein n=1 Tax=Fibrella musci TaxID=3242485 RepID=UPI0035206D70